MGPVHIGTYPHAALALHPRNEILVAPLMLPKFMNDTDQGDPLHIDEFQSMSGLCGQTKSERFMQD